MALFDSSIFVTILVALFVGSFVGILVLRLPVGDAVVVERSKCRYCGHRLGVRGLVPLLSWIVQRGDVGTAVQILARLRPGAGPLHPERPHRIGRGTQYLWVCWWESVNAD